MEVKKKKFEKDLVNKIQQKLKGKETEESFLVKAFKFMDIYGTGKVNFDQFSGAISRMGFVLEKSDMQELFKGYDTNSDQYIDYKEFCGIVVGKGPEIKAKPTTSVKDVRGDVLIDMLKKKLNERGAKGIMGLMRCFKVIDKDKSNTLSLDELKQAMKDFKLAFDDGDIEVLFKELDKDKDSSITQEEFLRAVRGDLNAERTKIVLAVFSSLDKNGDGIIDLDELKAIYSGARHPAVLEGRKTEKQILEEFAGTFELHAAAYGKGEKDSQITKAEFLEYYTNVSASIDSDEYFLAMMRNCWKIDPEKIVAPSPIQASSPKEVLPEEKKVPAILPSPEPIKEQNQLPDKKLEIEEKKIENEKKAAEELALKETFYRFRSSIINRGVKGILGVEKQFKVYAKDGTLELDDFKKAVEDFRLHVEGRDLDKLFTVLDPENKKKISLDAIMNIILGEVSDMRRRYIESAFVIIDKDKDGLIDSEDISRAFEGWKLPDVKSGKKRQEDLLHETIEILDNCTALHRGVKTDGRYSKDEFAKYYAYIGAGIASEADFENLFLGLWKIEKLTSLPEKAPVQKQNSLPTPVKIPSEPTPVPEETKCVKPEEVAVEQEDWTNTEILDYLKQFVSTKGVDTVFSINRMFIRADKDKSGTLTKEELTNCLEKMGVHLIKRNLDKLFKLFDTDKNGTISYKEFTNTMIGEMNEFREKVVESIFAKLDKEQTGQVEINDLIGQYDPSSNPDVLSKKKTEKQILAQFMDMVEMYFTIIKQKDKDHKILLDEFKEFYNNISCTIERDDIFEKTLQSSWKQGDKTPKKA